jgi:hypothetical protein
MSEYTPTTAEVSRRYMLGAWEESGDTSGDDVAQFDRWLASMKADAWEECAQEAHDLGWLHEDALEDVQRRNPYRGEQA